MNRPESRYIEKKTYLSRYAHERLLAQRESPTRVKEEFNDEWFKQATQELPRFIPFLTKDCGVEFRGRVLEIGAGGAWLSAALSKLPKVVEVITTDLSPKLLKEQAPRVFDALAANTAKITRMPADFHQLDFPNDYFDFVVASSVLHQAANIVQVLREAKRVLKPGGQFIVIREPVWPLLKIKSREKMMAKLVATGINERFHTLSDYREFFRQAALPCEARRVSLASGFKYYVDKMVNGITHARYAFIATKRGQTGPEKSWRSLPNGSERTASRR